MKILTRNDFQFEPNLKYYFYREEKYPIEICLEPCFNGFDVAIYNRNGDWLIRDKECTDEQGYGSKEFIEGEIYNGPQLRRPETWNHALKIANRFYSSFMNYVKLKKIKMVDSVEGEEDIVFQKVKDKSKIHSLNPRSRI